jgi:peroxiredoxin
MNRFGCHFRLPMFCAATLLVASVHAAPKVGDAAPDFTLMDFAGKPVKLSDYKGRHVVLEWTNPHCPYVAKHYNTGNLPALQQAYTAKNVAWLLISSTRPDHYEFTNEGQTTKWLTEKKGTPTRSMLDKDGKVGRLYEARTTPHMFIVDPQGKLIFAGGIDDKRGWNPEEVKTAKNFVRAALDESLAGKPVTVASAIPYG